MEAQLLQFAILAIVLIAVFMIARQVEFFTPFLWIIQIVVAALLAIMFLRMLWPLVFR